MFAIVGAGQAAATAVETLRREGLARAFSCCYLRERELLAIDCVNHPKHFMAGKKLIAERAHFDLVKLADARVALKDAVLQ